MEVKSIKIINNYDVYVVNFEVDKELFYHIKKHNRAGLFSGQFIQALNLN